MDMQQFLVWLGIMLQEEYFCRHLEIQPEIYSTKIVQVKIHGEMFLNESELYHSNIGNQFEIKCNNMLLSSCSQEIIPRASANPTSCYQTSVASLIEFTYILVVFVKNCYSRRYFYDGILPSTAQNSRFWTISTGLCFDRCSFISV